MSSPWVSNATRSLASGSVGCISQLFGLLSLLAWDSALVFINLITPKKHMIPVEWPEYIPPKPTDSRSPCPGLNALSNHGILPHDGRGITFKQMEEEVQKNYNCSKPFCRNVIGYIVNVLKRDYDTGSCDLSDISVHNGIEHDGSMTRYDMIEQPDQSIPAEKLIRELLAASKDGEKLTPADFSRIITSRLTHSKETNSQFSIRTIHMMFAAGNAATLLLLFGGKVKDIEPFLLEERIPEGWTPKVRSRMGLTTAKFNSTSLRVLLGIDPSWKKAKKIQRS